MADDFIRQHTVLIFAYHFPPEPEIGAARPFRFYKYLTRLGYSCKVITAVPQGERPPRGVTYIPDPFSAAPRRGFEWQLERAMRWSLLPGAVGMGWSRYAYRAAREIIRRDPASRVTVISTFPPLGVQFAGWRLARAEGLPWIADFRDPLGGLQLHGLTAFQQGVRRWLERWIICAADAVIANTDVSQQIWQRQHPYRGDRIHLLWNGFDPEKRILAKPLPRRGYKVLSHTGSLYAGRTVGPILESVDRLIEGRKISPDAIRIRLIGEAEPSTLGGSDVLARAQAKGWLELTKAPVPPAEALDIMITSDYLLVIQQQSITQVPGKLFEYLQTGRPILAYVTRNSPTERILVGSGVRHRCVYPDDSPQRLDQVIAEFLSLPTNSISASPWFEEQFNGEEQTRALAAIIDSTTIRNGAKAT